MRSVAPRIEGSEEFTYPGSEQFMAITMAHVPIPNAETVQDQVTRWTLTPEERQRIASGEDLYMVILVGKPSPGLVPHRLSVGWSGPTHFDEDPLEEKPR